MTDLKDLSPQQSASTFDILSSALQTILGTRELPNQNQPGLGQSKYDFNYRAFPADLGSEYSQHYMVINVNVPVFTGTDNLRGSYYGARGEGGNFTSRGTTDLSKVDNLRFGQNNPSPITGAIGQQAASERIAPQRSTRRIIESIALYMPSPMIYTQANIYEEVSLTSIAAQVGKLAALPIAEAIAASTSAFVRRSIQSGRQGAGAAGNLVNADGNLIGTGFSLAGYPINPRIEVLFANTPQRQFNFEFMMAPRNEKESKIIRDIVRTLRFHAAPEIDSLFAGLLPTFIPPAEFDITFYQNGVENLNIPRINTCVLERCEVDYAPTGAWSTFSNGQPVAVKVSLAFREIEIVHKRRVVQGF